jgi:hypothetical protein
LRAHLFEQQVHAEKQENAETTIAAAQAGHHLFAGINLRWVRMLISLQLRVSA